MNESIATPVACWERLVGGFPLSELWNSAGRTAYMRQRELQHDEVVELLALQQSIILAVACHGHELRWYPQGKYGFWNHVVSSNNSRYSLSYWTAPSSNSAVILLEQHDEATTA
jgi:hypothetical protein